VRRHLSLLQQAFSHIRSIAFAFTFTNTTTVYSPDTNADTNPLVCANCDADTCSVCTVDETNNPSKFTSDTRTDFSTHTDANTQSFDASFRTTHAATYAPAHTYAERQTDKSANDSSYIVSEP